MFLLKILYNKGIMSLQFKDERSEKELSDLKKEEEEKLVELLANTKYNIPYINLSTVSIENDALRSIREEEAKKEEIAPFKVVGKNLHIAIRSPQPSHIKKIEEYFNNRGYITHFYMASSMSLEKAWERYLEISYASESKSGSIDISGETLLNLGNRLNTLEDIIKEIKETEKEKIHTTSRILEVILAGAIAIDASDIHFEPEENNVGLRYRLDGILQEVTTLSNDIHKFLNSRIKLLAGLKITSQTTAQDGRFSIFMDKNEINIRVSLIPGAYGESIVMRILNPKTIKVKLEDMGIEPNLYKIFMREIKKPNGLILLTGPTGSGKTTTLYSFLQKIYSTEIKIITIEDPIEYHIDGITQTQVETEKGYTFLEGLRSSLRQDPDVIMVGEIRDSETAKIAVESALTGHLVFSTLHTNNAAGVIPRLIDLEVNPKILVSALSLSIAQRLVRRLCKNCMQEDILNDERKEILEKVINEAKINNKDLNGYLDADKKLENMKVYKSVGCSECNNTGFKGRIGIFEAILNDEMIEKIITENPSEREIKKASSKQGVLNMKEDGVVKILNHITSFEEVMSVVDFYED